jgi:LPXTG-motif cell wall-anchored protein
MVAAPRRPIRRFIVYRIRRFAPVLAAVPVGGQALPDTGSNVLWWVIGGLAVLAIGGALYALSRRHGSADSAGEPPAPPAV